MKRRLLPLLVLLLLGACQAPPDEGMPRWRRPGPPALGPQDRHILPDDGFYNSLA